MVLVLLGVTALLAWLLSHAVARVAIVEITLSEGLATQRTQSHGDVHVAAPLRGFDTAAAGRVLEADSVNIFASSSCTTCVRLVDELGADDIALTLPLHLWFSSDAPHVAKSGTIHTDRQDLVDELHITATPYAVVVKDGVVASHGAVPRPRRLQSLLAMAGLQDRLPARLLSDATRAPFA